MKCPHCLVEFHSTPRKYQIGKDAYFGYELYSETCPSCKKMVLFLIYGDITKVNPVDWYVETDDEKVKLIYPKGMNRSPLPQEVPKELAEDYVEACLVLADSPKASAALSRRCLQQLLRDYAKVKKSNLSNEIEEVINNKSLPSHLSESIDAIRNIGNFAAHPIKSTSSGKILPVEDREAEWNIDVLEALFDFYFVQPQRIKAKKDALNKKLKDAGKKEMK